MTSIRETLPDGRTLAGHCDPAFAEVLETFRQNFIARKEVGASLCLTHQGHTVVDLWGGWADPQTQAPWTENTISIIYSCTKAATALSAHMLVERGLLDYDMPVGDLWPEFAAAGKEDTTVAMMLAHTAPVPHLRAPIKDGGLSDWDYMVARVAAEEAHWAPGTRQGYHGLTYAWTVGQLVRLAAKKPLADFFRDEIATPLGLDFHIGLPEADEARVAPMIASDPAEVNFNSRFFKAVTGKPGSLPQLFLTNQGKANFNSRDIHAAEIGSANGISNARGLAGMYAPLANGGGQLLRESSIHKMSRVCAATQMDAVLMQPMRFSMGFMTSTDNRRLGGDSLLIGEAGFGHVGMGGSIGFADPDAQLSFGYTMNRMGAGILLNERGQSLVDAAYRTLGWRDNASGAWRP